MGKHKDRESSRALFAAVQRITAASHPPAPLNLSAAEPTRPKELRKMKKFRFQLLHRWLTERFPPCRVADIGGGKGLLAYLLQQSGWQATVIDPVPQLLPDKYKDIVTGRQVKIPATARVPRRNLPFTPDMATDFDLLIGLHAHGCNGLVIDTAVRYGCGFVLLPCCVIDEPFTPPPGVDWLESLAAYAVQLGHTVAPFQLNFKGQNIGLCVPPSPEPPWI
jgi:hypothetical protein